MTARSSFESSLSVVPVAWPTLAVAAAAVLVSGAVALACLGGALPLWAGSVLITVAAFAAFTPMHDAAHRSVGRSRLLNEGVGRIASLVLFAPFAAFRWVHLEHHKHTNDAERDPDHYSGLGPWWMLPVRWLTQDLHYYVCYAAARRRRPWAEQVDVALSFAALYGLVVAAIATGYGVEVVALWLVPSRLAIALLAFSFDYLPHRPHDVTSRQDRYRATSLFTDRWLIPLFLYQSYHLIHHLYPGVPFYRYGRVYEEQRAELCRRGAAVHSVFERVDRRQPAERAQALP